MRPFSLIQQNVFLEWISIITLRVYQISLDSDYTDIILLFYYVGYYIFKDFES